MKWYDAVRRAFGFRTPEHPEGTPVSADIPDEDREALRRAEEVRLQALAAIARSTEVRDQFWRQMHDADKVLEGRGRR